MAVAARSAYYADGRDKSSFDVPGTRRPMRCLLAADLHYSLQQFDWACWTPAGLMGENFSLSRCRCDGWWPQFCDSCTCTDQVKSSPGARRTTATARAAP